MISLAHHYTVLSCTCFSVQASGVKPNAHFKSQRKRKVILVFNDQIQEDLFLGARILPSTTNTNTLHTVRTISSRSSSSLRKLSTVDLEDHLKVFNIQQLIGTDLGLQKFEQAVNVSCALLIPYVDASSSHDEMLWNRFYSIARNNLHRLNACLLHPGRDARAMRAFSVCKLGRFEARSLIQNCNNEQRLLHALLPLNSSPIAHCAALLLPYVDTELHEDARALFDLYDSWMSGDDCGSGKKEDWLVELIANEEVRESEGIMSAMEDLELLKTELELFCEKVGLERNAFPSITSLRDYGRDDIADAIHLYHGGAARVCRLLKLKRKRIVVGTSGRRKKVVVEDDAELKKELEMVAKELGIEKGVMPSNQELVLIGRKDLKDAVRLRGGYRSVAQQFGLGIRRKGSMMKYEDLQVLKVDLMEFVKKNTDSAAQSNRERSGAADNNETLPRLAELKSAGRNDLINAIKSHGGLHDLAKLLNMKLADQK